MARKRRDGGDTFVFVKDRGEDKVRCRSCSSVMYVKDWWFHKCQEQVTEEEGLQSQATLTSNLSKKEVDDGSNE